MSKCLKSICWFFQLRSSNFVQQHVWTWIVCIIFQTESQHNDCDMYYRSLAWCREFEVSDILNGQMNTSKSLCDPDHLGPTWSQLEPSLALWDHPWHMQSDEPSTTCPDATATKLDIPLSTCFSPQCPWWLCHCHKQPPECHTHPKPGLCMQIPSHHTSFLSQPPMHV